MIPRFAVAVIGILIGLAYSTAMKGLWDDSIIPIIQATPGATDFEVAIFSMVPLAILVAVFATGVLLIIRDPKEGGGGF